MEKNKKILTALLVLVCFMAYTGREVTALDAPHDKTQLMECLECHVGPNTAPWSLEAPSDDDYSYRNDFLCLSCHEPTSASPMRPKHKTIKTHSSFATSNKYGSWTVNCVICHDEHLQYQYRQWKAASYLESGTITAVTGTMLTDSTAGKFAGKDYAGYILLPNVSAPAMSYVIIGNDDNTIRVRGSINLSYARAGNTYAVAYGKMIQPVVLGKYVRFFHNSGPKSFADNDAVIDGICQVCHIRTTSFTSYGILEGPNHPPATAGTNCMTCHPHSEGFKAIGQQH